MMTAALVIWDKDEDKLNKVDLHQEIHKILTEVINYKTIEQSTKETIFKFNKQDRHPRSSRKMLTFPFLIFNILLIYI